MVQPPHTLLNVMHRLKEQIKPSPNTWHPSSTQKPWTGRLLGPFDVLLQHLVPQKHQTNTPLHAVRGRTQYAFPTNSRRQTEVLRRSQRRWNPPNIATCQRRCKKKQWRCPRWIKRRPWQKGESSQLSTQPTGSTGWTQFPTQKPETSPKMEWAPPNHKNQKSRKHGITAKIRQDPPRTCPSIETLFCPHKIK